MSDAGRRWLVLGAFSGFAAVALGAFAAHGLRARLAPELLAAFETGVRYQMYHALALLAVGALAGGRRQPLLAASGALFALGTLLFSGSLYLLALGGPRWAGAVTPLGGIAFLGGWLALAVAALRRPQPPSGC